MGCQKEGTVGKVCGCGVLPFESDGPPRGRCLVTFNRNGASVVTKTGNPRLRAELRAIVSKDDQERTSYVFEGTLSSECAEDWCGSRPIDVLYVEHLRGYRAVVTRSEEGPPSRVFHLNCGRHMLVPTVE